MRFRKQLHLSFLLLILPLVVITLYLLYHQYQDTRSTLGAASTIRARDLAQAISVLVDQTVSVQHAVGLALVEWRVRDASIRQHYLDSALASSGYLQQLAFADPSGKIIEASPRSLVGTDVSGYGSFRSIRSRANWAVSHLYAHEFHGAAFVVATGIRNDQGRLLGVVLSGVNDEELASALQGACPNEVALVLIDSTGRVASTCNTIGISKTNSMWLDYPFVKAALGGSEQQVQEFKVSDGPVVFGTVTPIRSLGWAAGVFLSQKTFLVRSVTRPVERTMFVALTVLVLTVLIGSIVAKRITTPIIDLSRAAEGLGRGELGVRANVPGTTELAELAETMNWMAESIQQRDDTLRQAYRRERRIASTLQQTMIPIVPAQVGGTEIASAYFPALAEAELGGDFFDVMVLPNGLIGLLIGDVSGKGLSAAIHTAMAKYMIQGFMSEDPSPADALRKLNRALSLFLQDKTGETFITAFLGVVDVFTGKIVYSRAAHPPPVIRHSDGTTEWLDRVNGPPLGVFSDAEYYGAEALLIDGGSLLLYTDGVIEAHRDGRWFGTDDLERLVGGYDVAPSELVHLVFQTVADSIGGEIPDDVALVAIRMKPSTEMGSGQPTTESQKPDD